MQTVLKNIDCYLTYGHLVSQQLLFQELLIYMTNFGRLFFKTSLSSPGFFKSGLIRAVFKDSGTIAWFNDALTILYQLEIIYLHIL